MATGKHFFLVVEGQSEYKPPIRPRARHKRCLRGATKI